MTCCVAIKNNCHLGCGNWSPYLLGLLAMINCVAKSYQSNGSSSGSSSISDDATLLFPTSPDFSIFRFGSPLITITIMQAQEPLA